MKRVVTFLLVLVSLVGIIGYSPASAKSTKSKEWRWKDNKDLCAYEAFDYCTDNKYVVVVKNAEKYSGLRWKKSECETLHTKTPYIKYTYYSLDNITVQLQLVNAKTGKPVKANKVKWYGSTEKYDRFNRYYVIYKDFYGNKTKHKYDASEEEFQEITLDGEYSPSKVVYKSGIIKKWGDSVYALYKNKLYEVYLTEDWETHLEQKNPWEDYEEAWNEEYHLVPDDYVWCANTLDWYKSLVGYHTCRTLEGVMLVKGTKQKWVLKSCLTGDTISLDKCKFYVEEYDEGALVKGKKATTTAKYFNGLYATPEARVYVIYDDKYYWCDVYIYDTAEDAWDAECNLG